MAPALCRWPVGVPIEVVQMILGHSSPEVTRKVHAYLLRKATGEQVDKATQLLTRHRPQPRRPDADEDRDGPADDAAAGALVPA
jgi:proteasome lid subunit RPN8/RPN11